MNTGFYEVMRKELRNAVEDIRTELEHVCTLVLCRAACQYINFLWHVQIYLFIFWNSLGFLSTIQAMGKKESTCPANGDYLIGNSSDVIKAVSSIRQNYSTKLEQVLTYKQYWFQPYCWQWYFRSIYIIWNQIVIVAVCKTIIF